MSSNKQLIINCGASRVTAASLTASVTNLEIDKVFTVSLDYDYSEDDGWLSAVGVALRELSQIHKISGKASFIIPGNQVLAKNIRIPHVEEAKRAQIIAFEAQQNIPYPLYEVVWDSQVVDDDGVETEVLFIACKSTVVDEFCANVSAAGFIPETISAATVLDYNAIQYACTDVDEDVLIINIGARSTNLLFRNADGFFARNIQLGGNSLTQRIADSLGKSFAQAEELKHKFFSGGVDLDSEDSGAKLLRTSSDNFIRRMSQEITRSIVNYRRQKGAAAPKQILLSGRGAMLKGLTDKLSTDQKMPVSFFDPMQNVSLLGATGANEEELRHEISEIIGQASIDFVPDGASVNLLPDEIQAAIAFKAKKPLLVAAALLLALAPWPAFVGFNQLNAEYSKQAQAIKNLVSPLESKQAMIRQNGERAIEIGQSIERVEGLVNSKTNWIQFFADLQDSLTQAEDVWLDTLFVERGGMSSYEVVVAGQMLVRETAGGNAFYRRVISKRINSLQASFEGSEFIVDSKPPSINWNSLRNGLNVLSFTINLVVDPAKPL